MILNKYQKTTNITERGYSATCFAINEVEEQVFVKWLKGIEKNSEKSRMLSNRLRQLKKATHPCLPNIIEYGWDESQKSFCTVFQQIKAEPLENIVGTFQPSAFFQGILAITNCLKLLNQKHKITHGDITPANLLVDQELDFYLVDFGLSNISATLSQISDLEIFAKAFAAPEKFDKSLDGFAHQSDIYSLGKVMNWYCEQKEIDNQEITLLIDDCCRAEAFNRISFNSLAERLEKILKAVPLDANNIVQVENISVETLEELNTKLDQSYFDVSPRQGDNILLDIVTPSYWLHCLWLIADKRILVRDYKKKDDDQKKYEQVIKYGQKLPLGVAFQNGYLSEGFDLTPIFKRWQKTKQREKESNRGKRAINTELKFYEELLKKEIEEIEKNALKLRYSKFEKRRNHEVWFYLVEDKEKKYSQPHFIDQHIEQATPPHPLEFEYILSETADKSKTKSPPRFSAIAFQFDKKVRALKFKDCEYLDFDKIPQQGYLFQNTRKQEEEKKRQQDAIRKVRFNEVQNAELIHYLFHPKELEGPLIDHYLTKIYQTDDKGKPFEYSPNQTQAIVNALYREPLSIIQGPPGTGKTTVITEIVFQIISANPDAKILITSQTNDAVDHVLDNLLKKDIPIVRLSGVRKPKGVLRKHTLEKKIEGWKDKVRKRATKNWKQRLQSFKDALRNEGGIAILIASILDNFLASKSWETVKNQLEPVFNRNRELQRLIPKLKDKSELIAELGQLVQADLKFLVESYEVHQNWLNTLSLLHEGSSLNQKLIDSIQVLGATTNHIAAKKYSRYNFSFDYVIMDESGKATPSEALIPLVMAEKAVLVGDHRQLRPMLTSNHNVEKWLRKKYNDESAFLEASWEDYFNRPSLFEQIIEEIDEDFKSQLTVCRRCSEDQVKLISKSFYEPFGDAPIEPKERPTSREHQFDLKVDSSIIFYDIGHDYKSQKDKSASSFNQKSAKLIPKLLMKLISFEQAKPYSFGIITGYKAQYRQIKHNLRQREYSQALKNIDLTCSVVDKFQGLEKDIILFDLVKTGHDSMGFLDVSNRINVALSRQKRLVILIGDLAGLKSATSRNGSHNTSLHKYLNLIKPEWVINSIDQLC